MRQKPNSTSRSSTLIPAIAILCAILLFTTYSLVDVRLDDGVITRFDQLSSGGLTVDSERLSLYCNAEPPTRIPDKVPINNSWELQYMALNIRHGDRSSIHRIPGTALPFPLRTDILQFVDNRTSAYIDKLRSFSLTAIPSNGARYNMEKNEERDLKSAINPKKRLQQSDHSLPPGQLTTRGFMQHIQLGQLFHNLYGSNFFSKIKAEQMYVRSTNYARTVQSVSALLIAMMPHLSNTKRKVAIRYFPHEEDEIMHGLGVRSSSYNASRVRHTGDRVHLRRSYLPSGSVHVSVETAPSSSRVSKDSVELSDTTETTYSGGCESSVRLAAQQAKLFAPNGNLVRNLAKRLGEQVISKPIGQMADAILPNYCHARPMPCSAVEDKIAAGKGLSLDALLRTRQDGGVDSNVAGWTHCLRTGDLELMMVEADRQYCERYAGLQGGLHATKLSIFPFLSEIAEHLVVAALSGASQTERLSVFSGHDTVIAPVLAGLGAYAGDLCIWPGYASNIAFELWQPAKGKHSAAATMPSSVTTTALQKLFPRLLTQATASDKLSYSSSFVRVFFNGEDITQRIPSCAAERVVHSSSSSAGTPSGPILTTPSAASNSSTGNQELLAQAIQDELTLCSLEALVSQVASLVEPVASISEACSVP